MRLNCTHFLILKIHNGKELKQTAIDHPAGIDYKDFVKIYKNGTKEPYEFLFVNTTLPVDKRLKKNFSDAPL